MNMKKIATVITLSMTALSASAFAFSLPAHAAASAVTTGNITTVQFHGSINAGACNVDPSSADQVVNMGSVASSSFTTVGDTGPEVPFTLKLTGCDTTTYSNVAVAFSGATPPGNSTVLAVDNSLTGGTTATGVGIALYQTGDSTALTLDGTTFDTDKQIVTGNNTLSFNARYISTDSIVTAGAADASAQVNFQYE